MRAVNAADDVSIYVVLQHILQQNRGRNFNVMIMTMTFIQYSSEFSYENDNILFQVIKIVFNLINDWWVIKYSEVVWCWCWLVQCTVAVEGGEPMPGRVRSAKVSAFLHHTTNHGLELVGACAQCPQSGTEQQQSCDEIKWSSDELSCFLTGLQLSGVKAVVIILGVTEQRLGFM